MKKLLLLMLTVVLLCAFAVSVDAGQDTSAAGMAAWAWRAYNENWRYAYGSASIGTVDDSGLIYSYVKTGSRISEQMFANAPQKGNISTIPDIPGVGVYMYGHVGVYVGNGVVIDARNEEVGITVSALSTQPWSYWFYIPGVNYDGSSAVINNDSLVRGSVLSDGTVTVIVGLAALVIGAVGGFLLGRKKQKSPAKTEKST